MEFIEVSNDGCAPEIESKDSFSVIQILEVFPYVGFSGIEEYGIKLTPVTFRIETTFARNGNYAQLLTCITHVQTEKVVGRRAAEFILKGGLS